MSDNDLFEAGLKVRREVLGAEYVDASIAASGKAPASAFSSCRQTTSGSAASSHASRFASRLLILLMLKVAIFTRALPHPRSRRAPGSGLM